MACIVVVSLIEPVFQTALASSESPQWANAYVGLHVFTFNVLGLFLFRRYGFLAVYVFRFVYYLHRHILWGYLRLQWLF